MNKTEKNPGLKSFDKTQTKILLVCFVIYFCAYIGRLNLSATLEDIMAAFPAINDAQAGLIQTVFAITYAAGQLTFGLLSDKLRPRSMLLTGLIGSALCNLMFSFMRSYYLLLLFWTLNGAFQAMLWTPIVICMAHTFRPEQRKSASFVMSFTLAAGHFAAWGLAIGMSRALSWRWSYRLPTLILLLAAALAYFNLPKGLRSVAKRVGESGSAPIRALLGTGIVFMLLCCVANGFVRDGVITWAPTIIGADSKLFSLIIPCINLFGILLGSFLVRKARINIRALTGIMMLCVGVFALILTGWPDANVIALALLLGFISALLYGTNPLLTTLVPMQYDALGRVGLVAGLNDSAIYVGSALAGSLTGLIRQQSGSWQGVYLAWLIVPVCGCVLAVISGRMQKKIAERRNKIAQ